jgi:hypothetical protein
MNRPQVEFKTSPLVASARRDEVTNSLTEKCENCTICESPTSTIAVRLEHAIRSAYSWSSHHQSGFNLGIPSVSSSRLRGLPQAPQHEEAGCQQPSNSRRVCALFDFLISFRRRSRSRIGRTLNKYCNARLLPSGDFAYAESVYAHKFHPEIPVIP